MNSSNVTHPAPQNQLFQFGLDFGIRDLGIDFRTWDLEFGLSE